MKPSKNFYQWDINQKFTECDGRFVDFIINEKLVYRVDIVNGECIIPDEFLQKSGYHTVYECMSDYTIQNHMFPVHPREKPPGYVYTPTEKLTFEGLVQKVNDTVADMIRRADSGEFDGYTPVKGKDYFTQAEKNEMVQSVASGAIGEFREVVNSATADFNENSSVKTNDYNTNAEKKLNAYDSNAAEKLNAYDSNAAEKLKAYNDNHTEKMTAYDINATDKLSTYNSNSEQKLEAYNSNHTAKLTEYNANAETKKAEFDSNAAALKTEVDRLRGECDNLAAENRKQENKIGALIKLNKGQTYDILPEEGETASRTAPSGAKYVSVDKVGGKSVVWNQLWNYEETAAEDGVTCTYDNYFYDVVKNTTANNGIYVLYNVKKSNKYYLSFEASSSDNIVLNLSLGQWLTAKLTEKNERYSTVITSDAIIPTPRVAIYLYSSSGVNCSYRVGNIKVIDLSAMFGAGNEPTAEQFERMFPAESYPYNPGEIVSTNTKTIGLTPSNIFPGTEPIKYYPVQIRKGETFTVSSKCKINTVKCRYATEDGSKKDYYTLSDLVGTYEEGKARYKRRMKASFDISRMMFDVSEGVTASDFVVEIGDGDGTYKKYFDPAQLITGFPELHSANTVCDTIDFDRGEIRRNVGVVDLDTLDWIYNSEYKFMLAAVDGKQAGNNNLIMSRYNLQPNKVWQQDSDGVYGGNDNNNIVYIKDMNYADPIAFKAALNGVVLHYELANPTTEKVTIPEALQEWLPVEPGGTVTFQNADESKQLPVPNAVSWVRKLDEVN